MIASPRAYLAIVLLATPASLLGSPLAHAGSTMHFSGNRSNIHSQEHLRFTTGHLPCIRQAPPRRQVEDPLADINLG
ncbi:hypothetical protein FXV83_12330 [Bradyrhizobium hipponense]|uniref:Secreted protein n=1 Tax=Bradyrhizobium hipponense TaxID=2605638 RepID=A0A5S4YPH9_9BRAD|nr:hypothetical protein [Bradyrhizobium hipponense]TYO66306.1 hypothetical protein FXV83_12330 [Bradyrhizobium hipponense]